MSSNDADHSSPTDRTAPATIDLTPAGAQTVEGQQRIATTTAAADNARQGVADAGSELARAIGGDARRINRILADAGYGHLADPIRDLIEAANARHLAEDNFLRAVAGHPPRPA